MATYPLQAAIDVPIDSSITVTFDMAMDPSSISAGSFTLDGPRGTVEAVVTREGDTTAVLTPIDLLAGRSVYTAHLDRGIRSAAGQGLGVPYAWSFTTGVGHAWLYADIEFTIRDNDNDAVPDEMLYGGPPSRFLQTGVNGLQVDRAIMEFSLDQIVHDSVLEAVAFINVTSSSVAYGLGRIEAWGYAGNGAGELADWDAGALSMAIDSVEFSGGQTIAFPMTDMINAALDSAATHVGFRVVVTGEPVIEIANSGPITVDDRPRILLTY